MKMKLLNRIATAELEFEVKKVGWSAAEESPRARHRATIKMKVLNRDATVESELEVKTVGWSAAEELPRARQRDC